MSRHIERTPEIVAAIRDCLAAGRSQEVTAELVGIATPTVRRIMREQGIPAARRFGRPTPWTPERVALLLTLYRAGLDRREIACRLGITRDAVCGKLHRLRARPPDYPADDWDSAYDAGGE